MSKIVDRESLKAFRERLDEKYVIEGEYSPQTTVGLADNFTPYSEDSGAEQSNPFISNGTGTNNNQEIVTVGDYGLLRSKNGNSVVVNQRISDTDSSKTLTFATTETNTKLISEYSFINGHKYLIQCEQLNSLTSYERNGFQISKTGETTIYDPNIVSGRNTKGLIYWVFTSSFNDTRNIRYWCQGASVETSFTNFYCIDLTQWFNGNIPQDLLDNPSHFSWYYNGSLAYNTGTLVNANGVKLVSTGRQLWDEVTKVVSGHLETTNYQLCIPNTTYYFAGPNLGAGIFLFGNGFSWYDKDFNRIGSIKYFGRNTTQISPSNAKYFKFSLSDAYGTTYNNDITISLYYTPEQGGEGYDKYYPYETPYEVNTGSEVLRSAGSVYDYKEPNGTIHRVVGVVDLGTLDWTKFNVAQGTLFRSSTITNANLPTDLVPNVLCKDYLPTTYTDRQNKTLSIGVTNKVDIIDNSYSDETSFQQAMSGVYLYYELATPTTEQGTPFAENLPINDYGMLYWDSDIPQGNTIFFPINYKGFLDDMYSRVDGDSSKYVIDTDLSEYVKQEDLSSGITDVAGLTYSLKSCIKTGKLITLTIKARNLTGNTISASTVLFTLPSGTYVSNDFYTRDSWNKFDIYLLPNGNVTIGGELTNNSWVFFTITYAI